MAGQKVFGIDDIVNGIIKTLDNTAGSNLDWNSQEPDPASSKAPWRIYNIGNNNIDLFHYDSDKSYSGRVSTLKILCLKMNSKTVIIFDDIQDNFHFKDFVNKNSIYCTLKFENKLTGITGYDFLFS